MKWPSSNASAARNSARISSSLIILASPLGRERHPFNSGDFPPDGRLRPCKAAPIGSATPAAQTPPSSPTAAATPAAAQPNVAPPAGFAQSANTPDTATASPAQEPVAA